MQVVLFAAQSLDGWIARHSTAGDGFASTADKTHFSAEIRRCDACVMGRATYDQSKHRMRPDAFPSLRRVVWTRAPESFAQDAVGNVLEFTSETPGATVARLRSDGRARCALLGGGQVNAAGLAAGLVDELCVTVEPVLFGRGTPLVDAVLDLRLELLEAKTLAVGGPVLLRYAVKK